MNKKRTIYIIGSVIIAVLIVITSLAIVGISLNNGKSSTKAEAQETVILTVDKTTSIKVIVSGMGVTKVESGKDAFASDKYEIEKGSEVTLRAINYTRIFESWQLTPEIAGVDLTDSSITFKLNQDLNVSYNRRNPLSADYGMYLADAINIRQKEDLERLQLMFEVGTNIANITDEVVLAYDHFFNEYGNYTSESDKKKAISDTYFNRIQYGYFHVVASFALFERNYYGIGNETYPFKGVFSGYADNHIPKISITTTCDERSGINYTGLFEVTGEEAVISDLNVSYSVNYNAGNVATNIYVGGIAGKMTGSYLSNVEVKTSASIDKTQNANIYVGGIAGRMENGTSQTIAGFDNDANIRCDVSNCFWNLQNLLNKTNSIKAGLVAGDALNVYINGFTANVTNFAVTAKHIVSTTRDSTITYNNEIKTYLGNIFGYYENNQHTRITKIIINGTKSENLSAITNNGTAYVGGIIGYVNALNKFELGRIRFKFTHENTSDVNTISAQSLDLNSKANVYTGGIIGKTSTNSMGNIIANDNFKKCIHNYEISGVTKVYYEPIFDGNFEIKSIQNGINEKNDSVEYGKCVAGGFVASGYIDMNGEREDAKTDLVITRNNNIFMVNATQSTTTTVNINEESQQDFEVDVEHCCVGLIYGLIQKGSYDVDSSTLLIKNINYYIDNAQVSATRDMGSTANGSLYTGGFIGHSFNINYENISMLMNDTIISGRSYSNDNIINTRVNSNNVHTGGFAGEYTGNKSKSTTLVTKDVIIQGFNFDTNRVKGTNLQIESTQNSKNPSKDYCSENYVGGVIGKLNIGNVDGCKYIGLSVNDSHINLLADKSPDTSFCGGIIGFIKNNISTTEGITTTVQNCEVENVSINGITTVTTQYENPDMYVAGIIGACFNDNTGATLNVNNCKAHRCHISALGNERIVVYAAGIIGINTWNGGTNINDCYVYHCMIYATEHYTGSYTLNKDRMSTYAAGIIAETKVWKCSIKHCAVFDTTIIANTECDGESNETYSAGVISKCRGNTQVSGCYSNARVESNGNTTNKVVFAIADCKTNNGGNLNSESHFEVPRMNYFLKANVINPQEIIDDRQYIRAFGLEDTQLDGTNPTVILNNVVEGDAGVEKLYAFFKYNKFTTILSPSSGITLVNERGVAGSDRLDIYVNPKQNGNVNNPNFYTTEEAKNEAGWFLLGSILVKGNSFGATGSFSLDSITYPDSLSGEEFQYIKKEDTEKYIFENIKIPHNTRDYIGYTEINLTDTTITIPNLGKDITRKAYMKVNVYDSMPDLKLIYRVKGNTDSAISTYHPTFYDEDGKIIDLKAHNPYGQYVVNAIIHSPSDITYELVLTPNPDLIIRRKLYLGFRVGTSEISGYGFEFDFVPNDLKLVGATYAEYTLPSNYYDSTGLGTESNPWKIRPNSVIKIIPLLSRINDPKVNGETTKIFDESNIQYVNYRLGDGASSVATIDSSGELKTLGYNDSNIYSIIIENRSNPTQIATIYFEIEQFYTVTYSSIGADIDGLLYVCYGDDYFLDVNIQEGYGGIPVKFRVFDGVTLFNRVEILENEFISETNGELVRKWNVNISHYHLLLNKDQIKGNITIEIEFQEAYTITLEPQCEHFHTGESKHEALVLKVPKTYELTNENGESIEYPMTFNYYFRHMYANQKEIDKAIEDGVTPPDPITYGAYTTQWIQAEKVNGYVNLGFYLIDNADSITSYGIRFLKIIDSDLIITTSYIFYARWSFLIEIIEAPGTHIKTSFQDDFMQDYGVDESGIELSKAELEKLGLRRAISIPINNNRGYAFTIEKDPDFIGEASVAAYIYSQDGQQSQLKRIHIEKYNDNMYIYYIPPEVITGYLVVCTSVTNTDFIVGSNTSSVTDNVLPEDGIYTFKYVANHFNKKDAVSYIYNSGKANPKSNLGLTRDIILQFYQQTYNDAGSELVIKPTALIEDTIIEVYYHQYINGILQEDETIIGTYHVKRDAEGNLPTEIFLSDFYKTNYIEKAFPEITYDSLLGDKDNLSEEYYFAIIPPNGYTSFTTGSDIEISNHVVHVGYYDQTKRPANPTEEEMKSYDYLNPHISGIRTERELANIPLGRIVDSEDSIQDILEQTKRENALHSEVYTIIPSRTTKLTNNADSSYTFKDKTYFEILDLTIRNQHDFNADNGYIYLDHDTVIESGEISFGISKLNLTLGFGMGEVRVYAKTQSGDWEECGTIKVDSINYKEYSIDFSLLKDYKYFKIINMSYNLIMLRNFAFASGKNGLLYEITPEDYANSNLVVTNNGLDVNMKIKSNIIGDSRHDGKKFILEVQFKDNSGNIIDCINKDEIFIMVNGTKYTPYGDVTGKNAVYFNLSQILSTLDGNEFTFNIDIIDEKKNEYKISTVILLEVVNAQKPAMGEIRDMYTF